jgi:hypothetical protein
MNSISQMEVFQQTSYDPYDRHTYKVYLCNGKIKHFEFYDDAKDFWFSNVRKTNYLNYIMVEDHKQIKSSSGFKNQSK